MCVQDAEQVSEGMEDMGLPRNDDDESVESVNSLQPSHSGADAKENRDNKNPSAAVDPLAAATPTNFFPVGKNCLLSLRIFLLFFLFNCCLFYAHISLSG